VVEFLAWVLVGLQAATACWMWWEALVETDEIERWLYDE